MNLRTLGVLSAITVALISPGPAAHAGVGANPVATFDTARQKDVLYGVVGTAAAPVDVVFRAGAGTKLKVTLVPDDTAGPAGAGVTLDLCDDQGVSLGIAGSPQDKSREGRDEVRWKKVIVPATGTYVLRVALGTQGGWCLTLKGSPAKIRETSTTVEPLTPGVEATVAFEGIDNAKVKVKLKAPKGSKFRGRLLRIERPDGSTLVDDTTDPITSVTLDADGLHQAVFTNVANRAETWFVDVIQKPAKAKKRTGFVRPEGTALVPKVKSLDPAKGVHIDTRFRMTVTGLDFQPDVAVHLVRGGRDDIVGRDVTFVTETILRATFDLDTTLETGGDSVGNWKLGVWNAPQFTDPQDPFSLVKNSPTSHRGKKFQVVNEGSIRLPDGVEKDAELWFLDFNDGFEIDLGKMGFGSEDRIVREAAREAVKAYTLVHVRDLLGVNETTGNIGEGAVPVSFTILEPQDFAGVVGEDYNRIEIGGPFQEGDAGDPAEPLDWGFAPHDVGNGGRENLTVEMDDGEGGLTRIGHGARLRVLDPDLPGADGDFVAAMSPLRNQSLTASDRRYFLPGFNPANTADALRYRDIVLQIERASREIAAIVAHHIGKAMGLPTAGAGPMASPATAGGMWPAKGSLSFAQADLTTLRTNAVASNLPGKSNKLRVAYFPLTSTQSSILANATADTPYAVTWNYVGGRPNAVVADYKVQLRRVGGFNPPISFDRPTFDGFTGTPPLFLAPNVFYCDLSFFVVRTVDERRGIERVFLYRLNILADVPKLPQALRTQAANCNAQVLAQ